MYNLIMRTKKLGKNCLKKFKLCSRSSQFLEIENLKKFLGRISKNIFVSHEQSLIKNSLMLF